MVAELKKYKVVVLNAIEMLTSPADSTQARKNLGVKELKNLASFIDNASTATKKHHVKVLDPIPGLDFVFNYNQRHGPPLQNKSLLVGTSKSSSLLWQ